MDLIAEGRTAEVFDIGSGRILKLLRPGFPEQILDLEEAKTRAVHAAGVPAPAVFGRRIVDGRPGIEMERVDGRMMVDEIRRKPWTAGRWGRRLFDLHARVTAEASGDLPDVKERLAAAIEEADLPSGQRLRAKDALVRLPDGQRVLHGDFHPLNVMVDGDSCTVIDWVDAARGSPAADVARSAWLLSPIAVPPGVALRRIVVAMGVVVRTGYLRRLSSIAEPEEVSAWRLPVVAARLAEHIPHEEEALRAEVERLVP